MVQTGRRRRFWILAILAIIVVLPIAWYLGSPLFINRTVDEAFPMSEGATVPEGMTRRQVEDEMTKASREMKAASEPMPAGPAPRVLARGAFTDVDSIHTGSGTATIYRVGQDLVLRLEPFQSTNGPDLYVYLSGHAAPRTREQLYQGAALEVARLKGNVGAQNYTLPPSTDPGTFKSVVVYCKRFSVIFTTAALGAP